MKAIVRRVYGSTDKLQLADIDPPKVGDNEVLVRVRAAGVDRGVWHLMTGLPYLVRVAGYGFRAPKNPVLGYDVSGQVEAVGPDVSRFRPGDEVFGVGDGTFAELASVREDRLATKPNSLNFAEAAAVPTSALTALHGLRDHGRIAADQKTLIVGASGGVGTFAVQLAKAFGAEVTGVCSTAKIDLVRSLGADSVIDYTREDITDGGRRWDLILDIAGNRRLSHLRRALGPRGTLVIVGGENGGRWIGGVDRQLRALALSRLVTQKLTSFIPMPNHHDLVVLEDLIEAGKVTPVVDRTSPLADTAEAIRRLEQGRICGKLVITI